MSKSFQLPPTQTNAAGEPRQVGVELEYAGVGLKKSAAIIHRMFGGQIEEHNRFKFSVEHTLLGRFVVEFDSSLLKDHRYEEILQDLGIDPQSDFADSVEHLLESTLSRVIPFELVCPPVPILELHRIGELFERFREHGAKGTKSAVRYAFGLHLNPEVTGEDHQSVLAVVRAFMIFKREAEHGHRDFSRVISGFVTDFPSSYQSLVLRPDYAPTKKQFVRDYLEHNPTRDRALDLLPLFCTWNEELVKDTVEHAHLLQARPCFHYRYPNSDIDNPDWSLSDEWNRWVEIERLAEPDRLLKSLDSRSQELVC